MALYIPHSIFHLARLLYIRPETFGPYYVLRSMLGSREHGNLAYGSVRVCEYLNQLRNCQLLSQNSVGFGRIFLYFRVIF